MRHLIAAGLVVLLASAQANAQTAVDLLGERFVRKHEKIGDKAGLIEFVPAGETLDAWTSLVGYRVFLDSRQSATEAATVVVRLAQKRYPGAIIRVMSKGAEAIAEFVIATPEGLVEFNVFKYGPGPGGRGLASLQYARRYRGLDPADVRQLEASSTVAVAGFDLHRVRTAFEARAQARREKEAAL